MRRLKTALGAGVAVIAAIGFFGVALAQGAEIHTMTVTLPGGGVAQIQYTGPTPPRVTLGEAPASIFATMPSFFDASSPFAEMERISAAMDRQADRMFREAAALEAGSAQPNLTATSTMPAGAREYSFVSEMSGSNVCSRTMVITSNGNGVAPHVVTHTSGNCSALGAPRFQVPTQLPAASPQNGPRMIMTKAAPTHAIAPPHAAMAKELGTHPYAGRVHEASVN
jgi:hypothetical protein